MLPEKDISLDVIKKRNVGSGRALQGYALMMMVRPAGVYLAWLALKLGLTPRQVTFASFVFSWIIVGVAAFGGPHGPLAALIMVLFWEAVDVTDGSMARAIKKRDNFGGFLDYAAGVVLIAFLPFALGIGVFLWPEGSIKDAAASFGLVISPSPALFLAAGAGISVISLLMRLVNRVLYVRFGDSFSQWDEGDRISKVSLREMINLLVRNLETTGGMQALVFLLAALTGVLEIALGGYLLFYVALLIMFMRQTYQTYQGCEDYFVVEVRRKEEGKQTQDNQP
ncbi:MAG TPA: CDP-alcohol phosphatidyltransferase family protein [Syntrophales bacterium]|nr:CDP-alcohol phosphatidyltransferase family protein [Syntrophales bacterium]